MAVTTAIEARPRQLAELVLTGEFALIICGQEVVIPRMGERVMAYLALADRAVARTRLSGTLWPDTSEERAAKSLRSVLWRLHTLGVNLVNAHDDRLRLDQVVTVDLGGLTELAQKLIHEPDDAALAQLPLLLAHADVLPDWDDDWVVADRERYRLLRLNALERTATLLMNRGQFGDALLAATAAVHAEPLRETARRVAMQIHLAQGNVALALCGYREYRDLLRDEFGIAPSADMTRLVNGVAGDAGVSEL